MDYRQAGVDVAAGQAFVQGIRRLVDATHRPEVVSSLGGFAGLCELPTGYKQPLLVSGTDGVGTKLKVAQALNRHDTIGIDLVAMCVNDVLTCGAEPLFFLDYLACGKLSSDLLTDVVAGISQGCQAAGCALLGGETAEMPGFYGEGVYDLAGFCVGVVEKEQVLTGQRVQLGDIAIGLESHGVHSNGFSLVRKIISDRPYDWSDCPPLLGGMSLGDCLLTPTMIYVAAIREAQAGPLEIHGMAHITGGGLPENLPRCLGPHQSLQLFADAWPTPAIFRWLAEAGQVSRADMFATFNMGIGYVVLVPGEQAAAAIALFASQNISAYAIGEVVAGTGSVLGLPTGD